MGRLGIVGIIPARGGSKGLPGKNIKPLGGKPLLCYTIESAKKSALLDRVILTTDSEEIATIGRQHGAEVPFLRPLELASDTAHTPPVIEHAVQFLEEQEGYKVDIVVTLQPTSPFRRPEHIDQAVEKLLNNANLDSVITVEKASFPPFWMLRSAGDKLEPFVDGGVDYSVWERQQLPEVYQPNGAVYATRRSLLAKKGIIVSLYQGGNTGYIVMDVESSIDIDGPLDFLVAELKLAQDKPK